MHIVRTVGIMFICILVLPVASMAQVESDASSGGDSETSVSDLAILSIVAATQEGQDNVVKEDEPAAEIPSEDPVIQDTFNTQDAIPGDALHATENPEDVISDEGENSVPVTGIVTNSEEESTSITISTSTAETEVADESGTEDVVIPGPASLQVVVDDLVSDEEINPDIVAQVRYILPTSIEAIARVPLEEEVGFEFSLTGKHIPTTQRLYTSDGEVIDEKMIDDAPGLAIGERGDMTVSGVCQDAYFVVLLYKEAEEYERDPRSYILNRAYPCTGTFSYSVDSIPPTLPDGTYYLLIGEQGEVGDWVPITALTEITINRQ